MCFSASASFIASAVLATIGGIAVWRALAPAGRANLFYICLTPLLFATQQAAEGLVWLYGYSWAALTFLFFAFGIWPFYIPFALWYAESDKRRKALLLKLLYLGLVMSVCLLLLVCCSRVSFSVQGCHIIYDVAGNLLGSVVMRWLLTGLYCMTTVLPFCVSSVRYMPILGLLIGLSCIASYIFYTVYFISVWCFFAALVSGAVLGIISF